MSWLVFSSLFLPIEKGQRMGNKDDLSIPASEYIPEEEISYGEFKVALIPGLINRNNIKLNLHILGGEKNCTTVA